MDCSIWLGRDQPYLGRWLWILFPSRYVPKKNWRDNFVSDKRILPYSIATCPQVKPWLWKSFYIAGKNCNNASNADSSILQASKSQIHLTSLLSCCRPPSQEKKLSNADSTPDATLQSRLLRKTEIADQLALNRAESNSRRLIEGFRHIKRTVSFECPWILPSISFYTDLG